MSTRPVVVNRTGRKHALRILAIVFGAIPFAFALIRAATARDFRYLWMAIASFLGASVVTAVARARIRKPGAVFAFAILDFVVVAVIARSIAYLLGATATAAIWLVASAFALCWAVSYILGAFSAERHKAIQP